VVTLQRLWRGWGELVRLRLTDGPAPTVVAKLVRPPPSSDPTSEARKRRSYEVERTFYAHHAAHLPGFRTPHCYGVDDDLLVIADLVQLGSPPVDPRAPLPEPVLADALQALARLHAGTMGRPPDGLWPEGTYWHLATRTDELQEMADGPLRRAAPALDEALRHASHRCWVHGDAKPANLGAGPAGVAFVDFQYVGGGVGVRDVANLLRSTLTSAQLSRRGDRWRDHYLEVLGGHLPASQQPAVDEWRRLWPVAWADLERFRRGWLPDAPPATGYVARQVDQALQYVTPS
jgi:aminoglycoside phosphotransferase (APT) family kinase protein